MAASMSSIPWTWICPCMRASGTSAMKPPPARTMRAALEAAAITLGSSTTIGENLCGFSCVLHSHGLLTHPGGETSCLFWDVNSLKQSIYYSYPDSFGVIVNR